MMRVCSKSHSWTWRRLQPASMTALRCSQPRTTTPAPALPTMNVDGSDIAAAIVASTPSGVPTRWLATCRGPSVGITVTVVSPGS